MICAVIFGHRYNYDDEEFRELLSILNKELELIGSGGLHLLIPQMKYLQPTVSKLLREHGAHQTQFIIKIFDEHRNRYDQANPKDFIDICLAEIRNGNGSRQSYLNERTFISTINNLFTGGTETTATTLRWSLLYMIAYPEIQRQVQQELDTVVGRERLPRLSDSLDLPYAMATLLEIQRIASVLPLGVPHCAAEETTICGFFIPKGAFILPNLWAVHHDSRLWDEPSKFEPSRFLDSSGNLLQKPELIPFSTGNTCTWFKKRWKRRRRRRRRRRRKEEEEGGRGAVVAEVGARGGAEVAEV